MSNQPEKKQSGKVNYIWVLAGGYLLYLAFKLFRGVMTGDSDIPLPSIAGGVVFAAVGAYALYREWRAYKYGFDHIDDPDTWSDEEEDTQLEELMQATRTTAEDAAEDEDDVEEQA